MAHDPALPFNAQDLHEEKGPIAATHGRNGNKRKRSSACAKTVQILIFLTVLAGIGVGSYFLYLRYIKDGSGKTKSKAPPPPKPATTDAAFDIEQVRKTAAPAEVGVVNKAYPYKENPDEASGYVKLQAWHEWAGTNNKLTDEMVETFIAEWGKKYEKMDLPKLPGYVYLDYFRSLPDLYLVYLRWAGGKVTWESLGEADTAVLKASLQQLDPEAIGSWAMKHTKEGKKAGVLDMSKLDEDADVKALNWPKVDGSFDFSKYAPTSSSSETATTDRSNRDRQRLAFDWNAAHSGSDRRTDRQANPAADAYPQYPGWHNDWKDADRPQQDTYGGGSHFDAQGSVYDHYHSQGSSQEYSNDHGPWQSKDRYRSSSDVQVRYQGQASTQAYSQRWDARRTDRYRDNGRVRDGPSYRDTYGRRDSRNSYQDVYSNRDGYGRKDIYADRSGADRSGYAQADGMSHQQADNYYHHDQQQYYGGRRRLANKEVLVAAGGSKGAKEFEGAKLRLVFHVLYYYCGEVDDGNTTAYKPGSEAVTATTDAAYRVRDVEAGDDSQYRVRDTEEDGSTDMSKDAAEVSAPGEGKPNRVGGGSEPVDGVSETPTPGPLIGVVGGGEKGQSGSLTSGPKAGGSSDKAQYSCPGIAYRKADEAIASLVTKVNELLANDYVYGSQISVSAEKVIHNNKQFHTLADSAAYVKCGADDTSVIEVDQSNWESGSYINVYVCGSALLSKDGPVALHAFSGDKENSDKKPNAHIQVSWDVVDPYGYNRDVPGVGNHGAKLLLAALTTYLGLPTNYAKGCTGNGITDIVPEDLTAFTPKLSYELLYSCTAGEPLPQKTDTCKGKPANVYSHGSASPEYCHTHFTAGQVQVLQKSLVGHFKGLYECSKVSADGSCFTSGR